MCGGGGVRVRVVVYVCVCATAHNDSVLITGIVGRDTKNAPGAHK